MNKWLTGNGVWCSACEGTGRGAASDSFEYESGAEMVLYKRCPACDGEKRVAAPVEDVIAGTVPASAPKYHSTLSSLIEHRPALRS